MEYTYLHFKARTTYDSLLFKRYLYANFIPYSKDYPLRYEICVAYRELDIMIMKQIARSYNVFTIYETIKPKLYNINLN